MSIQAKQVEITPVEENLDGELAKEIYYECNFCGKRMALHPFTRGLCEKLTGELYFCNFCLRHGFHTKNNRHVLMLSFRSIIGSYYEDFYKSPMVGYKKMYLSEIQAYIDSHVEAGLLNPTFSYDPETFMWFVDFNRIGRGNKKQKVRDVLKTVLNILACFNLKQNSPTASIHQLYEKYRDAIDKFYTARYRPNDRRILAPTLTTYSQKNSLRCFTRDMLVP